MNKYDKLAVATQKFYLALINCDTKLEIEKLKPSLNNISKFSKLLFKDTTVSDYLEKQVAFQILRVQDNLNSNSPKDSEIQIEVTYEYFYFKIHRKVNSIRRFFEIYDSMKFPEFYMIDKTKQYVPQVDGYLYNKGKFGSAVLYNVSASGKISIAEFMNELKIRNIDERVKYES